MASKRKTPKPRRTKEFVRRSRASKKGWETRRRRAEESRVNASIDSEISKLKRELAAEKKKSAKLEQENIQIAKKQIAQIQDFMNEEWVYDDDWLMTKQDGTRAKHPSRLRLLPLANDVRERLVELAGFDPIVHGVKGFRDEAGFYAQARRDADFFDIPIREVYTLFWSP